MDTAILREVIETQILRRGKGIENDPVRVVTQFWTKDGELLGENDPCKVEVWEFADVKQAHGELLDQVIKLQDAICWALGEGNSDFGDRPHGKGAFWWRKELRERAGL